MIDKNKILKIILLGAPGSGKGSLAQKFQKYEFIQISTGDLFRAKLKQDDQEARMIQNIINRGELIPDDITNKLATDAIVQASNEKHNIILDGYPRTIDQAKYLETITNVDYVIYLDVDEKILFERITGRLSCSQCNRIYNIYTNPPKKEDICDDCNVPLSKRRDDNEESFTLRMQEYKQKTAPLIEFYKNSQTTKFIKIDQDRNTTLDQMLALVLNAINHK